jgi:hypothetical protein
MNLRLCLMQPGTGVEVINCLDFMITLRQSMRAVHVLQAMTMQKKNRRSLARYSPCISAWDEL